MDHHSVDVTWTYVVPPSNTRRMVITQRQDGPFHHHPVGAEHGYYDVSQEMRDTTGRWQHVPGSTVSASAWSIAHWLASERWGALVSQAQRVAAPATDKDGQR